MNKMNKLSTFLEKHYIQKGQQQTHTRIGDKYLEIKGGCYCIEGDDLLMFQTIYYNEVIKGNKMEYLTEKQPKISGGIYVDLDFRYNTDIDTRQHTREWVEKLIYNYTDEIKKLVKFENNDTFKCFIMEKPNVNLLEDYTKDGLHLLFNIEMDRKIQQQLRTNIINSADIIEMMQDLPLINSLDAIFDNGLTTGANNNQMIGSRKPANEAYELTGVKIFQYDDTDGEFCVTNSSTELTFDLFRELSTQEPKQKFNYTPLGQKILLKLDIPKSPTTITEGIISDEELPIGKQNNSVDYNEILEHANNIDMKYLCSGQYSNWIKIVWALRSSNDISYKNIAIKLAKRCGRDIKTYVDTYWDNYTDKGINMGTIFYYSLESNKSQYLKIKIKYSPSVDKQIFDNLTLDNMIKSANESDFADIYYETYKKNLVANEDKIYIYYNNEWRMEDENKPHILLNNINEWLKSYIKCCFTFLGQQKADAIDDKEEMKKLKELDDLIIKVNNGIKRVNFCKNVLTFIRSKLAVVFNKPVFDVGEQDHNNIHFNNGVYEMKNKLFRWRCYFDYVTKWLDYDYIPVENIDENIKNKVMEFFEKTQPDKTQRDFTLGYLSYCLSGCIDKQKFKMNVGYSASNGKSTEMGIHDMCFPIYTKKLVSDTFVLGYAKRHKHIIELLNNPIRLAYVEELPEKKLDIEFLKDFVDAKKISCEVMFGTDQVKKIQAKLMTCSNHDFHGKTDEGIKRRGMIQHYNSRFLKDDGNNEFSDEKHIYKRVDGFEKQFICPYFKNAYFHLLLKYYDNLVVPKINEDKFKEVCDDNDYFKNKLLEVYEITEDYECKVYWKDIAYLFGQQVNKEDRKALDGDMKRLDIPYSKDETIGRGKKGCYLGLKKIEVVEAVEVEEM